MFLTNLRHSFSFLLFWRHHFSLSAYKTQISNQNDKFMQKFIFFIGILFLFASCHSENNNPQNVQTEEEFLIARNQVGPVEKGMTIKQLLALLPEARVKKLASRSELSDETADNYYIYDDSSRLLFIVTPRRKNDETSRINRVIIKDRRFATRSGIGLSSTVGEIREAYPESSLLPSIDDIILYVRELDANFELDERHLPPSIWNDTTGNIAIDSIPPSTEITDLSIVWTYGSKNLTDKYFWSDLVHHFVNWVVTDLPGIILLIFIFWGLLHLLSFVVKRIKKAATERLERTKRNDLEGQKRINTIAEITNGVGRIFLWTIFILMILEKFSINIAPILASAGIVGLAVGFGAQELVRDFISGFFMLLEDQVREGDVAIVNGTGGTVEKIELRTITLRDASGVVHIFQNGKINTMSNMTKEWSAMVVEIGVAYKEDTDHVNAVLKQVADEMKADPQFGPNMISTDFWGVDAFADSSVVLKVKMTTQAGQQWTISREYRRRVKKAFDAAGIEIPFPHLSLYTGSVTKPMPIQLDQKTKEQ